MLCRVWIEGLILETCTGWRRRIYDNGHYITSLALVCVSSRLIDQINQGWPHPAALLPNLPLPVEDSRWAESK